MMHVMANSVVLIRLLLRNSLICVYTDCLNVSVPIYRIYFTDKIWKSVEICVLLYLDKKNPLRKQCRRLSDGTFCSI